MTTTLQKLGNTLTVNTVNDTTPQAGGDFDMNANQMQLSKGTDVASATALPILTDGNYFDVTGTTTVTSINTTGKVGTVIKLHFDGILTFTHHATNLILPGGLDIATAVGDEAELVEYASGDFRCTSYTKANGESVLVSSTAWRIEGMVSQVSTAPPSATLAEGIFIEPTGNTLYMLDSGNVRQYSMSPPWDTSSMSYVALKDVSAASTESKALTFNPDMTKAYTVIPFPTTTTIGVYESTMSTAGSITTATVGSASTTLTVQTVTSTSTTMQWRPDGLAFYLLTTESSDLDLYTVYLYTPWDITSVINTTPDRIDFGVVHTSSARTFTFSPDGTRLLMVGYTTMYEYALAVPFDLTDTANITLSSSHSHTITGINDSTWKPDGTIAYGADTTTETIKEFYI